MLLVLLVLLVPLVLGSVAGYRDWLRGWTVRRSNPGGSEIFCTCLDRPWGPPNLLYNGYRVFSGGKKRPGRDADPSPLLVPLVMKE